MVVQAQPELISTHAGIVQKPAVKYRVAQPNMLRSKREAFLESLRSNRCTYRRYAGLPLRYAGGKSLAVGHILNYFPDDLERLVSPFVGGGAVEIACAKELEVSVQAYDVFDVLVSYWQSQIAEPGDLADAIEQWKPNKVSYEKVKNRLKAHWKKENLLSDNLVLAAHYWFNHNLSYGPGFLGWMSKIYEQEERFHRLVDKVRKFNPGSMRVDQGDFREVIPSHRFEFLYCDPPYYLDGDSKMFRGIYPQRNFPVHHNGFDHEKLRDLLHEHKGGFVLSYNDCAKVREWYSDFRIVELRWQYTLGQGETRMGKNRLARGDSDYVKKSHELLIIKD